MYRLLSVTICAAVVAAAVPLGHPAAATAPDPITEWSSAAQTAVGASGMAPLRTPITFAILHLAMYDAVNAVVGDREPYAVSPPVVRPASAPSAAIEAGYRVLLAEVPSQQPALSAVYERLRNSIPDSQEKTNGATVGVAVA